ncbi:TLC domain-containing protein 2 [Cichlidogyrus casuarinus]|uniref:TLC domain-containing protein 2 n=1 Tax=Cichlidogyrus casuarinus TaxID=1844966 RepID=A0ABD2QQR2_9PLAT
MLRGLRGRQTYEYLAHHFIIFLCFGSAVTLKRYIGYGIVALLIEVNSINLHIRRLLTVMNVSKRSLCYRINGVANIFTYIVFRLVNQCWMARWLILNRDKVPFCMYSLGSISLAVIMLMNIVLFWRIIRADFLESRPWLMHKRFISSEYHSYHLTKALLIIRLR